MYVCRWFLVVNYLGIRFQHGAILESARKPYHGESKSCEWNCVAGCGWTSTKLQVLIEGLNVLALFKLMTMHDRFCALSQKLFSLSCSVNHKWVLWLFNRCRCAWASFCDRDSLKDECASHYQSEWLERHAPPASSRFESYHNGMLMISVWRSQCRLVDPSLRNEIGKTEMFGSVVEDLSVLPVLFLNCLLISPDNTLPPRNGD